MTQQVSHRPIKFQSRSWSQRGTKVNRSHHGDNPLLSPTEIQITTNSLPGPTNREHRKLIRVKTMSLGMNYSFYCHSLECYQYFKICITSYREDYYLMCCPSNKVIKSDIKSVLALGRLHEDKLCDTLQALAPTNVKTVHQTSLLHIENNFSRHALLSPTHSQCSQQQSGQITLQSVLTNKPKFLRAIHNTEKRKIEISRSMVVEAQSWGSQRASQYPAVQSPVHP